MELVLILIQLLLPIYSVYLLGHYCFFRIFRELYTNPHQLKLSWNKVLCFTVSLPLSKSFELTYLWDSNKKNWHRRVFFSLYPRNLYNLNLYLFFDLSNSISFWKACKYWVYKGNQSDSRYPSTEEIEFWFIFFNTSFILRDLSGIYSRPLSKCLFKSKLYLVKSTLKGTFEYPYIVPTWAKYWLKP